jgi:hypothetical protein
MSKCDELEDYLQHEGVFVSGIDGRHTHMDSYMTVIDFTVFDKALAKAPFTEDELLEAAGQMNYHSYLSPMAGLASMLIQTKLCPAFGSLLGQTRAKEKLNKEAVCTPSES